MNPWKVLSGVLLCGIVAGIVFAGGQLLAVDAPSGEIPAVGGNAQAPSQTQTPGGTPPVTPNETSRDALYDFASAVGDDYPDARVIARMDGDVVVVEHAPASNPKKHIVEIAMLYADVRASHDHLGRLIIRTNGVETHVPPGSAVAYANDEINREAFVQTLEITNAPTATGGDD